ncbi:MULTISPECIES: GGDEF domain-containing protein [Burkholderia]|uniref:GGDEF domain-containing protein n=1 Tax=Burkholderia TaxID=32008 RepID=UPI00158D0083|nr:sensor domain-containing diguanylate cyclase [Burkholderia cepacia]MCA8059358.1 sensor domain-containing diguanylate cyclase [Burkholderia cepacia]MCA8135275.1 sensor domain-containing diguanylate cyclase [Burkholderia cepacia]MCA8164529.1 sensor domain-containing diguanylate cyclase [Burkholderia cepacia]MDN7615110.1 sensor domain-containing diguanylate cyclase [Burkholderia cepacia]HEM7888432.1 sensor domain-containing diguanylate cyclase [Burkholderia cepacia]
MQIAPKPADEAARLDTLHSLSILDTPPEERFDRLTRLARRLFDVPIALVSLVDDDRQWFKSHAGLDVTQTSRDVSFCSHALLAGNTMVIQDALNDDRFHDNPLVTGAPGIRFYAGRPLAAPNGAPIGTLCLIDTRPRSLEPDELALLGDLAHMTEREIAALHFATTDELTQLTNRRGFEILARHVLSLCDRLSRHAVLLFFDLNDFKAINDRFGHAEGDRALKAFADTLTGALRDSDVIARLGGDEFVVLLSATDPADVAEPVDRVTQALALRNTADARGYDIRFSVGHVDYDPAHHHDVAGLLASADQRMYEHKQRGRSASA